MLYTEQVSLLSRTDAEFAGAVALLEELGLRRRPRVVHFSHHDADGIACALVMGRLLRSRLSAEVTLRLPPRFKLTEMELDELGREKFDLLLITDKGTFASYDDFLSRVGDVLVIDHHRRDDRPTRCVVFNPSAERSVPAAASLLCHMLASRFGPTGDHDDFAALIGCRGDFAFDPVEGTCADFARPFVERAARMFPRLFDVRLGQPTMYDVADRRRTALINQLTEAVHAGSLGQYYGQPGGPGLVYNLLASLAESGGMPRELRSLDEILVGNQGRRLAEVLRQFRSDWALLEGRTRGAVYLGTAGDVGVYLFFAREAPKLQAAPFAALLPAVANTRLEPLRMSFGHSQAMAIVFCPKEAGVQISMRGGGELLDCAAMCSRLAGRLRELHPGAEGIEGGGHASAAECYADKAVPMYSAIQELVTMIGAMTEPDIKLNAKQV